MSRKMAIEVARLPEAFQQMRSDYVAGKRTRFQRVRSGVPSMGASADYHIRNEAQYLRMLEYARDFARNDTVPGAAVERTVQNVFQCGYGFDPQTGDAALDLDLFDSFEEWSGDPSRCDSSGRFTLHELAEIGDRAVMVDGDILFLPRDNGTIQTVEAHRLRTPSNTKRNVALGVLMDAERRPVEYWITPEDIDPYRSVTKVSDIEPYPAFDSNGESQVWHLYDTKRFSQTRGVTAFAPVFERLGLYEDIHFANLVKAQIAACFAFLREQPPVPPVGPRPQQGPQTTETMTDGSSRTVEQVSPGMEIRGRPGEKLTAFAPAVPNTEFFEHAKWTLKEICAAVHLPLISLLMDGSETNFSGWRGAIDQAKIGWRRRQKLWATRFFQRAYRFHVQHRMAHELALRATAAKLEDRIYRCKWNPPRWPYIQPKDDIEAGAREIATLQTSWRRSLGERGHDPDEIVAENIADNEKAIMAAIRAAQRVLGSTGVAVDAKHFLVLPTGENQSLAMPVAPQAPPTPKEPQ